MKICPPVLVISLVALVTLSLGGCSNQPTAGKRAGSGEETHEHEHEHAHKGPHGGHIMEIGEEEYHAEWTHDESGRVTFYILDADAKKEVPIEAETITIEVRIGDNPPVSYELAALSRQDGKSAAFEVVDKNLLGALETIKSEGVVATLHVTIGQKHFSQRIAEHEH